MEEEEAKGECRRVARSGGAGEDGWVRCFVRLVRWRIDLCFLKGRVMEDAIIDLEVDRGGMRKLELCHISVSSLFSSVVGVLVVKMLGLSLRE